MKQLLFDLLLEGAKRGGRFPHRLLLRIRDQIVRTSDPVVDWQIGGRACVLPLGHDLPFNLARYPQYCGFIVRVAEWLAPRFPDFAAIDVGANIGDTALMLREKLDCGVLCIEGNPRFASLLRKNVGTLEGVATVQTLLGEKEAKIQARMVVSDGSSAVATDTSAPVLETETLDHVLATQPAFANAKLLKIDTDGYDLAILRGAAGFLESSKPVIAFEYDPHHLGRAGENGLTIFPYLRRLGYGFALFYDNIGDLLVGVDLSDEAVITSLHEYFSGRSGHSYADICVFHREDAELAAGFHASERRCFQKMRGFTSSDTDAK